MAKFQSGQRLTAKDLNDAFRSVDGVQNPSPDYNWRKTPQGSLQNSWSVFTNVEDQNASALDVAVSVEPLQNPLAVKGKPAGGLRRVFMNTGGWIIGCLIPYREYYKSVPPVGKFNQQDFMALLGWQWHDPTAPLHGDGRCTWSLYAQAGNQPASETPAEWLRVQKLYQDDVCRNCSPRDWWWTGITLENIGAKTSQNFLADIVAYPLFVTVRFRGTEHGSGPFTLPILCVSTKGDAILKKVDFLASAKAGLMDAIEDHLGSSVEGSNFAVEDVYFINNPALEETVAIYSWKTDTQDAHYVQQSNQVDFRLDFGGCRPLGYAVTTDI